MLANIFRASDGTLLYKHISVKLMPSKRLIIDGKRYQVEYTTPVIKSGTATEVIENVDADLVDDTVDLNIYLRLDTTEAYTPIDPIYNQLRSVKNKESLKALVKDQLAS